MTTPAEKKPAAAKAPRSTAAKAATAKTAAPKAAPKAAAPKAPKAKPTPKPEAPAVPVLEVVTEAVEDAAAVAVTRLKELVAKVAEATDTKKAKVRSVVEAFLAEVGAHLEKGDSLQLPGLGKMKVARTRAQGAGSVMSVKLKRGAGKGAKNTEAEPLADDGEAG